MLFDPRDLASMRIAVRRSDFVEVPRPGSDFHFVRYDSATDQWLWLHATTELAFGPYGLLHAGVEASCLARRQACCPMYVLAPGDAFWILLLHCLIDKGKFAPHHKRQIVGLAGDALVGGPLLTVMRSVCPSDWVPERIVERVLDGDWQTLEQIGPDLCSAWMHKARVGTLRLLAQSWYWKLEGILSFWQRRGLSVAVLGPDGAGKSTLVKGLATSWVFPNRSMYMGLTGGLLAYTDRLRLPGLVTLSRLAILWSRYLIAHYHRLRGRLVIFDRYIYDAVAPPPYELSWHQRIGRWIEGHACPGPSLVLLLDAPGAVLYARKGEYSPEELERWRQRFLSLHRRVPQLKVLDSTRSLSDVRVDAVERLWRRHALRWRMSEQADAP